jgi:hypothetical protein
MTIPHLWQVFSPLTGFDESFGIIAEKKRNSVPGSAGSASLKRTRP